MNKTNKVALKTNKGKIVVELDFDNAPVTANNFAEYVSEEFFNGTIFHRVISGFMIQGGGMLPDMTEKKTKSPIRLESNNGLSNKRGTIAMARTMMPDSATSQFFINHADNTFLDYAGSANPGYTVFGKVVEGLDVLDEIASVSTSRYGSHSDVPLDNILIESVEFAE